MKKELSLFIIFLCISFISCSDDNEGASAKVYVPEEYRDNYLQLIYINDWIMTDKIELKVGQLGLFKIEGGHDTYNNAQSQNEEIANVRKHPYIQNATTIECLKLGSTYITVNGKNGAEITIPLTISENSRRYVLSKSEPEIRIIMTGKNESEDLIKNTIIEKIKERHILTGSLDFIYDKPSSGRFVVKNSNDEEIHSGVFEQYVDNQYNKFNMKSEELEYDFIVADYTQYITLRSSALEYTYFIEDLTELFRIDYPDIIKVSVISAFYYSWYYYY